MAVPLYPSSHTYTSHRTLSFLFFAEAIGPRMSSICQSCVSFLTRVQAQPRWSIAVQTTLNRRCVQMVTRISHARPACLTTIKTICAVGCASSRQVRADWLIGVRADWLSLFLTCEAVFDVFTCSLGLRIVAIVSLSLSASSLAERTAREEVIRNSCQTGLMYQIGQYVTRLSHYTAAALSGQAGS